MILRVVYGVDLTHGDTRHYTLVKELAEIAESISTPGKHVVEAFPSMQRLPRWAPGAGFQKMAADWKKEIAHIRDQLFDTARDTMVSGTFELSACPWRSGRRLTTTIGDGETQKQSGIKESVLTRLMESGEDEELVRNIAATMYAGACFTSPWPLERPNIFLERSWRGYGAFMSPDCCQLIADSQKLVTAQTNSSVHAFVLAMAKFPEAQKRAQQELDAVIGPDRLPRFSDLPSLPYMNALIREVFRWHIVAPIGVPHRAEQDDEYNGYLIPSGAVVMVNQWYVLLRISGKHSRADGASAGLSHGTR